MNFRGMFKSVQADAVVISNTIIEAGFPPVGVHSAKICINFALKFSEICLHPRETDSLNCVANLG